MNSKDLPNPPFTRGVSDVIDPVDLDDQVPILTNKSLVRWIQGINAGGTDIIPPIVCKGFGVYLAPFARDSIGFFAH